MLGLAIRNSSNFNKQTQNNNTRRTGSLSDANDEVIFNRSHRNQNEIPLSLKALETNTINDDESEYKPTNGMCTISLSSKINDDDKYSEEEDDDEPCSDALQDSMRDLKSVIKSKDSDDDHQEFILLSSSDVL